MYVFYFHTKARPQKGIFSRCFWKSSRFWNIFLKLECKSVSKVIFYFLINQIVTCFFIPYLFYCPSAFSVSWFTESSPFTSALTCPLASFLQGLYCLPKSTMIFLTCQVSRDARLWIASCYFQILAFSGVPPWFAHCFWPDELLLRMCKLANEALKLLDAYLSVYWLKGCQSCLSGNLSSFRLEVSESTLVMNHYWYTGHRKRK